MRHTVVTNRVLKRPGAVVVGIRNNRNDVPDHADHAVERIGDSGHVECLWGDLVGRAFQVIDQQVRLAQRERRVLVERERVGVQNRRVIDFVDSDREGLRSRRVYAATRRAAVVVDLDRHCCGTVRVGSRSIGQSAHGTDGRLSAEESVVAVGDDEVEGLARLVRGTGTDSGRPLGNRLSTTVLCNCLVSALGEGGHVVDGCDGDVYGDGVSQGSIAHLDHERVRAIVAQIGGVTDALAHARAARCGSTVCGCR